MTSHQKQDCSLVAELKIPGCQDHWRVSWALTAAWPFSSSVSLGPRALRYKHRACGGRRAFKTFSQILILHTLKVLACHQLTFFLSTYGLSAASALFFPLLHHNL